MESFNDIKSLWQTDGFVDLPSSTEIEQTIKKYSRKKRRNNLLVISILACCLFTLVLIVKFDSFEMWSTYVGLLAFSIVGIYGIYTKLKKQNNLSSMETLSNNDFLSALEKQEKLTCIGKSRTQTILFIIWGVGFALYIYEFVSQNINHLLLGYGSLLVLSLMVWFFYLPYMTKRYQKDIQKTIHHIHHLKSQINDND